MDRRVRSSSLPTTAQFCASMAAYAVFLLSAGVYAGSEGRTRGIMLVVGLIAGVAGALIMTIHVWTGRSRRP